MAKALQACNDELKKLEYLSSVINELMIITMNYNE
jgi:hypothetical protein